MHKFYYQSWVLIKVFIFLKTLKKRDLYAIFLKYKNPSGPNIIVLDTVGNET